MDEPPLARAIWDGSSPVALVAITVESDARRARIRSKDPFVAKITLWSELKSRSANPFVAGRADDVVIGLASRLVV